jgi:hypothetical protein
MVNYRRKRERKRVDRLDYFSLNLEVLYNHILWIKQSLNSNGKMKKKKKTIFISQ